MPASRSSPRRTFSSWDRAGRDGRGQCRGEAGGGLSDAKRAFLAWFRGLARSSDARFDLPAALEIALEAMPAESFAVVPPPLRCKLRSEADLPAAVREQLVGRQARLRRLRGRGPAAPRAFGADDALRAISSLVADQPGEPAIARGVACGDRPWGLGEQAYFLFRRAGAARAHDPTSLLRHGPPPGRDGPCRPGDGLL